MKLGAVISSGGSAFEQVARIAAGSGIAFTVITRRPCGAEDLARRVGADLVRVSGDTREGLSRAIADAAGDRGLSSLILYFDRLVSRELFDVIPTYNVHPAALPAFKGLHGVEDAHATRARLIGCTLHRVDATMDGGEIVSQIARGADPQWSISRWQKLAFLMKVYCGLVWASGALSGAESPPPLNASHGLPEAWMQGFRELQRAEGEAVI